MKNALKRNFEKGQHIYVVDYWGTNKGTQAFEERATILEVDEKKQTFIAVLYGDTYQTYSFMDYGRLIFDDQNEAIEAADKLPKPKSTVYQLISNRVYKKLALGIDGLYTDGTYDLVVLLNRGKYVSTKEIGKSLFLNEFDARKNKNDIS